MANANQVLEYLQDILGKHGFSFRIESSEEDDDTTIIKGSHTEYDKIGSFEWEVCRDMAIVMRISSKKTYMNRNVALREVNEFNARNEWRNYWIRVFLSDNNSIVIYRYYYTREISNFEPYIKQYCISSPSMVGIKALEYFDGQMAKDRLNAMHKAPSDYHGTMKKILTEFAKQKGWKLMPQKDNNYFKLHQYEQGSFFLRYSTDVNNPTVDIEFLSFPFEGDGQAERVGKAIVKSTFANDLKVFVISDIQLKLKKTVALKNVNDVTDSVNRVIDCVNSLINTAVDLEENIQKWPTKTETEARIRELEEKLAAEERARKARAAAEAERERKAREAAAYQARRDEEEQREKDREAEKRARLDKEIAEYEKKIADMRADVAKYEAEVAYKKTQVGKMFSFTSKADVDKARAKVAEKKADLAKLRARLMELKAKR